MKSLPDAELAVMTALWDAGGVAGAEAVAARLQGDRDWSRTTLLTLLTRLSGKGFVRVEKSGRANAYTALVSREAYLRGAGTGLISRLCGGSLPDFVRAMCDAREVSSEEIAQLRRYVDELSGRGK